MTQTTTAAFADTITKWVGKTIQRDDVITARMVAQFTASFAPHLSPLPLQEELLWLICPDFPANSELGKDGHAKLGLFLPDLGFEKRMWAGGEILFHADILPEVLITRHSTIEAITPKSGTSGAMVFVCVRHHYHQNGLLVADERQDIVYRCSHAMKPASPVTTEPTDPIQAQWLIDTNSTLLFRYSAMTFNGHRIHYDQDFAQTQEGYEGLLLHGPIQATWLMMLAKTSSKRHLQKISYRGHAPFICGQTARVTLTQSDDKLIGLVQDEQSITTMCARITLR